MAFNAFRTVGPGIVIAATGVGAGDLITASVAGASFGTALLWAAVLGAVLKYAINENLARWQLVTGTTLLSAWRQRMPRIVSVYFLLYLLLWSFIVAGALISATGLAAHALFSGLSVAAWGILHSLAAVLLVWFGAYRHIENIMKLLVAMMFAVVMVCAAMLLPTAGDLLAGLVVPGLPDGSVVFVIGVIGGVGGSVTVMSYGYWIRERNWEGSDYLSRCRVDLSVAYLLTGLFGIAVMVIAAGVEPEVLTGSKMILGVADHLGDSIGDTAKWLFLAGFWGAVFSSMIGVWDGVPYLFADYMRVKQQPAQDDEHIDYAHSFHYRAYLLYLAIPPMVLLLAGKPVWVVIVYSVAGAFFMPFLAAMLLVMNNHRGWMGRYRNGIVMNAILLFALLLFGYLMVDTLVKYLA